MRRTLPIVALILMLLMPSSALASSRWDPDDVEGRFDLRWIGAAYTARGEIHLSVSFYDGFDWRLLPRMSDPWWDESRALVVLSGANAGYFLRLHGRVVFLWGDFGSTCCARDPVTRPSANVLSVTFDPCSYAYGEELDMAMGRSFWRPRRVGAVDETEAVRYAHPECD